MYLQIWDDPEAEIFTTDTLLISVNGLQISGSETLQKFFIAKIPQWLISGLFQNPNLHRLYLRNYKALGAEILTQRTLVRLLNILQYVPSEML